MRNFFKTGLLLMAISISLISCRDAEVNDDDVSTEYGVDGTEAGTKVKIKTDDAKIKVKTDDEGNTTKKVKIDNEE